VTVEHLEGVIYTLRVRRKHRRAAPMTGSERNRVNRTFMASALGSYYSHSGISVPVAPCESVWITGPSLASQHEDAVNDMPNKYGRH